MSIKKYTPKEYIQRLRRLTIQINKGSETVLRGSVRWGAWRAKQYAPKDTHALISSIHYRKSQRKTAWIVQKNPSKLNPKMGKGRNFNYAYYIYLLSVGKVKKPPTGYILKRGRLDYMRRAAMDTRKKFVTDIRAHVRHAIRVTK